MVNRGIARTLILLAVFVVSIAGSPANATSDGVEATTEQSDPEIAFDPADPAQILREIVFPVVGSVSYFAGFGDCRDGCSRSHHGIDIATYGWKGLPVVAAHDGTVISTRTEGDLSGCSVAIRADDGWTTRYIHLNTDTPGMDDDAYACFAPGIQVGARVNAGTVIGWIGDSGNAEDTIPNLHFEIRTPLDEPVDPWVSLQAAERIDYEWVSAQSILDLTSSLVGQDDGTIVVADSVSLGDLATHRNGPVVIDLPFLALDTTDPTPALVALHSSAPRRIIVLGGADAERLADDLNSLAPLVEVATRPGLEETTDPDDGLDPEVLPMTLPAQERDRFATVVGGRLSGLPPDVRERIYTNGIHHAMVILGASENAPTGIGSPGPTRPGDDASRAALWWNGADGWQQSDSMEDVPRLGIAYVARDHITGATTAYLVSLATAPAMPLWSDQPTSLDTRSP